MHRVVRLMGWTLVVALLVGVLWPERSEPVASSTATSTLAPAMAQPAASSPAPAPPACAPVCAPSGFILPSLPRLPG